MKELLCLLEEVEGKVIIWANYIYDIENIVETINEVYGNDLLYNIMVQLNQKIDKKLLQSFKIQI